MSDQEQPVQSDEEPVEDQESAQESAATAGACPPGYTWTLVPGQGMHCLNAQGYDQYGNKWR